MRIAYIVSTFPPYKGGMGNSVYHFAREMVERGHEIVIFTPAYDDSFARHETLIPRFEIVRLPALLTIGNAGVIPQLIWKLRKFDIIHLHYPFYGGGEMVLLALLFSRAKLMLHYHMDTVGKGLKQIIFRLYAFFFLPVAVRIARIITCASLDYVKHSDLTHYYQHHQHKFVQVAFGVDATRFQPGEKKVEPTILFVGGLDSQHDFKGVPELIDAFCTVVENHPTAHLVIVGKGDLEATYQQKIIDCHLENQAKILNSISDEQLADLYRSAWVTVLPSINRAEAFGLVLLESLASGTAVVASNLPGVRNVFRNGSEGYLVRPGDSADLAEKLCMILGSREKAQDLGTAGRHWVEEQYSWTKSGQHLETAYYRLLYTPKDKKSGPLKAEDDD